MPVPSLIKEPAFLIGVTTALKKSFIGAGIHVDKVLPSPGKINDNAIVPKGPNLPSPLAKLLKPFLILRPRLRIPPAIFLPTFLINPILYSY